MPNIFPIPALKDNYIWCLNQDSQCIVVDPGDAEPVQKVLKQKKLTLLGILLTHHHYDHTNGVKDLLHYYPVPTYGPSQISQVTAPLTKDSTLEINPIGVRFTVISIPGHTLEHVAYYQPGFIFTGDTLFTAGCGRIFEGTTQEMYQSLMEIRSLPDDTLIYCGHEYTENNLRFALEVEPNNKNIEKRLSETQALREQGMPTVPATLGLEKLTNPFLRCDQKAVIAAVTRISPNVANDPLQIFKTLREWKNNF